MVIIVKIIGLLFVAAGILLMIKPAIAKKMLAYWDEGSRIYGLAIVRIVVGVLLIADARGCTMPWLVIAIGVLPLVGGILILIMGFKKSKEMLAIFKEKPDILFRRLSFIPLVMGVLLIMAI